MTAEGPVGQRPICASAESAQYEPRWKKQGDANTLISDISYSAGGHDVIKWMDQPVQALSRAGCRVAAEWGSGITGQLWVQSGRAVHDREGVVAAAAIEVASEGDHVLLEADDQRQDRQSRCRNVHQDEQNGQDLQPSTSHINA